MNSTINIDPLIYHHHLSEKTEDLSFWMELSKEAGGPILELGCGTGRVISHLSQLGHRVVGLDLNSEMLGFLKDNLSIQVAGVVDIFQANLADFHLGRKFSLILLACNTLSTLDKETRERAFMRVHWHLSEGGIFAASIPNPVHLARLPDLGESEVEETIFHPETGNPFQISSEWERVDRIMIFRWHYDQLIPDGHVERYTIEVKHTLTTLEEYMVELQDVNLKSIKVFGDFDRSQYNQDSPYLILLARKGSEF